MRLFNLIRKINHSGITSWAIILILLSCNSTSITYSWKESITEPWHYRKILVVGIINNGDLNLREKMEMHLADDLSAKGYNAYSSLKIYGPKSYRLENENTILQQIQNEGYDALLTIVLLNKEKEKYYRPERMYFTPYSMYYGHFWGYYSTLYERTYEPGYYTESTSYFWESNLYDIKTQKLIYAVQTKSFDPSSTEKLAHEYGKSICTNLISQNLTH